MGSIFLIISLLFAVAGNTSVKLSKGFHKRIPSIGSFLFYGICLYFLTLSVQFMDVSIAYAIWSGVTIASTTMFGVLFFNESCNKRKVISVILVIAGVLILKIQG